MNDSEKEFWKNILFWILGGAIFAPVVVALVVLGSQGIVWLQTGVAPERDLFWLSTYYSCPPGTGGIWANMDLCRPSSIRFTDWLGLNKIANFIMDINLAIFAIGLETVGLWTFFLIKENSENVARLKATQKRDETDW